MTMNKYDDEKFFDKYSKMARSVYGLKGAGEWHELKKMLPDLEGKCVLDLGCGFGWHCKYAAQHGARDIVGIDSSERMLAQAEKINADKNIEYRKSSIEELQVNREDFDVVISSLALHYVEDFQQVCEKVHHGLRSKGDFVFSVEHPIFSAYGNQQWYTDESGKILHWPVDNYFYEGKRESNFLGEEVTKYHRTLTSYIGILLKCGFEIINVVEPMPPKDMLDEVEGMKDELRRPMMLLISARKK